MQESRRVETSEEMLAGRIEAWLDEPIDPDSRFDDLDITAPKQFRQETCITQIWQEMLGKDGAPATVDAMRIGKAMLQVAWQRTSGPVNSYAINKKYGKCRVYTRPQ